MEAEIEQLKREIDTLKCKNAEITELNNILRETNKKLQQSLDEALKRARPKPQPAPRGLRPATPNSGSKSSSETTETELRTKMRKLIRQCLDTQDLLTVAEQVTAATQRRELMQEGVYEKLPTSGVYETLRYDPTEEHLYTALQPVPHSDVLRKQYGRLSTELDAHTVAVHMYQRNALTLKELQSIQSLTDRPVQAAETLLNIIVAQPDAVYLSFLDVLKHTRQHHVYQTLVQDGYKEYDKQSSHTSVIRANYVYLLETLDVKFSGLVDHLYSDDVVSGEERDDITAEKTSFRANEKLLSALSRKSPQQFQLFLDELENCGQQHVRNVITGPQEGQVVHTLPEGPVVCGVTSLGEEIYLLRWKESHRDQVEVYDVSSYRLLRCLTVPDARGFTDMTSCEHYLYLYIGNDIVECVHRLDLEGHAIQWQVDDVPFCLSVNTDHNLIVTCRRVRKIKEFSSRGDLLRNVTLPGDVLNPWHAIQLASGEFIVCHGQGGQPGDPVHRVCKINSVDDLIVHSHGGRPGTKSGHYKVPCHLAVDGNEFVLVADLNNRRVTLLSPTLDYIRQVVSSDQLRGWPRRLCSDVQRRRLYVADNEWRDGKGVTGRVVVFSV